MMWTKKSMGNSQNQYEDSRTQRGLKKISSSQGKLGPGECSQGHVPESLGPSQDVANLHPLASLAFKSANLLSS